MRERREHTEIKKPLTAFSVGTVRNAISNQQGKAKNKVVTWLLAGTLVAGTLYNPAIRNDLKELVIDGCHKIEEVLEPPAAANEVKDDKVIERYTKINLNDALISGVLKDVRAEVTGIEEEFYYKEVNKNKLQQSKYKMIRGFNELLTKKVTDETVYANAMLGYDLTELAKSKSFRENFAIADNKEKTITILLPSIEVININIDQSKTKINNGFNDGQGALTQKDSQYYKEVEKMCQDEVEQKVKDKFERSIFKDDLEKQKVMQAKKEVQESARTYFEVLLCTDQYKGYQVIIKEMSDEQKRIFKKEAVHKEVSLQIGQIRKENRA